MKLHTLALASAMWAAGSAYAALPVTHLDLTDTHHLGAFDGGELYGEIFAVANAGTINHALTFNITGALYAGSGIFDLSLGNITNINGLTANIFSSGNSVTPYASFTPTLGGDLLALPVGTLFGIGSYTLRIGGQATGSGSAWLELPAGSYTIGAVTAPVPEPETWVMLLAGMGIIALRARQKAKAAQA
jgi:hypothetical protein